MSNKLSTTSMIFILGILIFLVGCIKPYRYDQAKASGCEVEATVVEVKRYEISGEGGYTYDSYTLYADYTFNGETYTHIKLKENMDSYVGEKITIVVNPNTGKPMGEGGFLCIIGFLISGWAIVLRINNKRARRATS